MTPQEAIAVSRMARNIDGASWPISLLAYLDEPPNERRVFDWLCSCVGELLEHFGKSSTEFDEALALIGKQASEGGGHEAVERRAWECWLRRSTEGVAFTAIAQLLFAYSRADRSNRLHLVAACSTPIHLLEPLESERGEVFRHVVSHFAGYVRHPRL